MASWMDPSTRKQRLLQKQYLKEMPTRIHRMPEVEVNRRRWEGCDFIKRVGEALKMYRPATSCACVLFNRFYARNGFCDNKPASWSKDDWQGYLPHQFATLSWRFVAVGCLFLAGKIEDNPKKITDVVRQFHLAQDGGYEEGLTEQLWRQLRETVLAYERLILQDVEFDMIVEAPVAFNQVAHLIKFITCVCAPPALAPGPTGGAKKRPRPDVDLALLSIHDLPVAGQTMLRLAAEFVNDSLYTTLWLEYDAPTIAIGLVWLTAKYFSYGGCPGWWRRVGREFREVNTRCDAAGKIIHTMDAPPSQVLDDIGEQMLSYYEQRRTPTAIFPPLPDAKTGLSGEEGDKNEVPFTWRLPSFSASKDCTTQGKGAGALREGEVGWVMREGPTLRCTCFAWRAVHAKRGGKACTCRCLISYLGLAKERLRVGEQGLQEAVAAAKYLTRKRLRASNFKAREGGSVRR